MEQSDLDLLQTVPSYHLQALAKTRSTLLSPSLDTDMRNSGSAPSSSSSTSPTEIAQILFDPASISHALHEAGATEKLILQELVACGGRANSRDLAYYFSSSGLLAAPKKSTLPPAYEPLEPPRVYQAGMFPQYPIANPHGAFEQTLHHLLVLGLLFWGRQTNFAGRDYSSGVHDGVLIVPVAVRNAVRSTWGAEMEVGGAPSAQEGEGVGEGARELQRTLYLYWSTVSVMREGLALVSNGLLARSALRHVVEHMEARLHLDQVRVESDAPFLLFIRLLLMQLGLLQERRGSVQAVPAEAFFSLPLLERARHCYRLYKESSFWNEILYLPEVNVRPGPLPLDPAYEEVVRSRQVVMDRVTHEPVNTWRDFPAFIARTKLYAPYLLFPRQYGPRAERYSSGSNPYGWDFRLRRGWLTHREGWHMVEGGFIRTVVSEGLHWLGIVELDREEAPTAFRLTSDAQLIMGNTLPPAAEASWGRLIVQPNFELVALAPVSELLLVTLDRFAERVSLEHIAQYRLTKASVTRAIQKGLSAEAIQEVLERAAGGEIPQNVRYSLVEWERQARRVEIWQGATLLEVDDAELLDALFADPQTRSLFGRRLAPRLAQVAPQQLSAVQEALWERNYLPALTSAPTQDIVSESGRLAVREPQWRLHDDGLLQPFYAVIDLYLVAEVERFGERDESTGWYRITPTSLRRALENGIELDHIIRFLQQYCEGGIPGSLLIRLKLWGNGYGDKQSVQVEHAPLLRLSEEVLHDLQGDEEIKQLLGREVEQPSRLVRIDPAHLEQIVELLRKRGFEVD